MTKNLLVVAGFLLALFGALLMWRNGLHHRVTINGGDASTDFEAEQRAADLKNHRSNIGVLLAVVGSIAQLAGGLMP